MTKAQVKSNVHNAVTTKTATNSISPIDVGQNMEDIIDLIPDLIDGVISYLPTPQIAKRKIFLPNPRDPIDPKNNREEIDSISTRTNNITSLLGYIFPTLYYKEQFDIYFNLFASNTNNWLSLPDKRIELCMVSNKSYKKIGVQQANSNLVISGKGNKDNFHNAIVHPANSGYDKNNIVDTIYSGGTAIGSDYFPGIKQTEWLLDETALSFGDNMNGSGLNRLNNPNITVEIDVRDFFQIKRRANISEELLSYPMILDNSEGFIRVKKIGDIKFNSKTNRVYKRNSVLFFRLSAGVPESYNSETGVYEKRIFSDLSQPIYITPKIGNFQTDLSDYSLGYKPYIFGHITKIGSK